MEVGRHHGRVATVSVGAGARPSQLIASVRWTGREGAERSWPGTTTPASSCCPGTVYLIHSHHRSAAHCEKQQLIGKNRQFMSYSGTSATQQAGSGTRA
jgi:hypothetical protein